MGDGLLDVYRRQWPRIGAVIALALGGLITLASGRLSKTGCFGAELVGVAGPSIRGVRYDPGYFPQFNRGLFRKRQPAPTIR